MFENAQSLPILNSFISLLLFDQLPHNEVRAVSHRLHPTSYGNRAVNNQFNCCHRSQVHRKFTCLHIFSGSTGGCERISGNSYSLRMENDIRICEYEWCKLTFPGGWFIVECRWCNLGSIGTVFWHWLELDVQDSSCSLEWLRIWYYYLFCRVSSTFLSKAKIVCYIHVTTTAKMRRIE